jgi:hypothetical protein
MDGLVKEAIKIKITSAQYKKEEGFKLRKAWNPRTSLFRQF